MHSYGKKTNFGKWEKKGIPTKKGAVFNVKKWCKTIYLFDDKEKNKTRPPQKKDIEDIKEFLNDPSLDSYNLCLILVALGRLFCKKRIKEYKINNTLIDMRKEMLDRILQERVKVHVKDFNGTMFNGVIAAFAKLGYTKKHLQECGLEECFFQAFHENIAKFTGRDIATIFWALAHMRYEASDEILGRKIHDIVAILISKIKVDREDRATQLLLVLQRFKVKDEKVKNRCLDVLKNNIKKKPSRLQSQVAERLKIFTSLNFLEEEFILVRHTDMYFPSIKTIVEVDGPNHFVDDELADEELEGEGFPCYRLDFTEFNKDQVITSKMIDERILAKNLDIILRRPLANEEYSPVQKNIHTVKKDDKNEELDMKKIDNDISALLKEEKKLNLNDYAVLAELYYQRFNHKRAIGIEDKNDMALSKRAKVTSLKLEWNSTTEQIEQKKKSGAGYKEELEKRMNIDAQLELNYNQYLNVLEGEAKEGIKPFFEKCKLWGKSDNIEYYIYVIDALIASPKVESYVKLKGYYEEFALCKQKLSSLQTAQKLPLLQEADVYRKIAETYHKMAELAKHPATMGLLGKKVESLLSLKQQSAIPITQADKELLENCKLWCSIQNDIFEIDIKPLVDYDKLQVQYEALSSIAKRLSYQQDAKHYNEIARTYKTIHGVLRAMRALQSCQQNQNGLFTNSFWQNYLAILSKNTALLLLLKDKVKIPITKADDQLYRWAEGNLQSFYKNATP